MSSNSEQSKPSDQSDNSFNTLEALTELVEAMRVRFDRTEEQLQEMNKKIDSLIEKIGKQLLR